MTWKSLSEVASPWFLLRGTQFGPLVFFTIQEWFYMQLLLIIKFWYLQKTPVQMDAFHIDSYAVVTCFRTIWSLVLSPGGWTGHSHSLAGMEGNAWWPLLQPPSSHSLSQKGSGPTWSSHQYHHLGSTPAIWGGRAGEKGKRGENSHRACFFGLLNLWRSWLKTPNHLPFCSRDYQSCIVNSWWSEPYWIKKLLDFMSTSFELSC